MSPGHCARFQSPLWLLDLTFPGSQTCEGRTGIPNSDPPPPLFPHTRTEDRNREVSPPTPEFLGRWVLELLQNQMLTILLFLATNALKSPPTTRRHSHYLLSVAPAVFRSYYFTETLAWSVWYTCLPLLWVILLAVWGQSIALWASPGGRASLTRSSRRSAERCYSRLLTGSAPFAGPWKKTSQTTSAQGRRPIVISRWLSLFSFGEYSAYTVFFSFLFFQNSKMLLRFDLPQPPIYSLGSEFYSHSAAVILLTNFPKPL